ncbi:MAG: hypothetical protein ABI466_03560 [Chloroflexota bacterium]
MIIDLDGEAPEPPRRGQVIALSAAAAAISLVLLAAISAPSPTHDAPAQAAAPVAGPTAGTVMTSGSGATRITLDQLSALRDDVTTTACVAGSGSNPSVTLVFDRSGQPIAAYTGGTTGRFIPLRPEYWGPFSVTVPCATSDVFAPRINRSR